jgi:hypothetical protein
LKMVHHHRDLLERRIYRLLQGGHHCRLGRYLGLHRFLETVCPWETVSCLRSWNRAPSASHRPTSSLSF